MIVSVITTVYNRSKFVAETIESVLKSTLKTFEYIIVDDNSTDNSFDICQKYREQDARIKLYKNSINIGDYPNRNKAAGYAQGKYIKYVDADDTIDPSCLEVFVSSLEQFPNCSYAVCDVPDVSENTVVNPRESYLRYFVENKRIFQASPLTTMIRRNDFNNLNKFKEERMTSDFDMWLRLSSKYDTLLIPNKLTHYKIHKTQESSLLANSFTHKFLYHKVAENSITVHSPLERYMNETILVRIQKNQSRLFFSALKHFKFRAALFILKKHHYNLIKVIKQSLSPG